MHHRVALAWAGVLGATGVILGAFGAHALKGSLDASGMRDVWDTASRYQLVHAAALAGLAAWLKTPSPGSAAAAWTVRLWAAGVILFSGSLYFLALGAPRWTGAVTPLGGVALIAGWVLAVIAAWKG
ncbi:MAG TPA: DUF423 domain-containing protein [Opitutaceae bacterium]|jgi:uncharacterized membrane protein YgdD (TMEM256/DUF423 family)|nr:DUF423 domain-containing protein [Opitutaceae bacterium]